MEHAPMSRARYMQENRKMRFEEAYDGWNQGRLTQAEAALLLGHSIYDPFERCFRPDPCWDWCAAFALTCRSDCSAHLGTAEPAASDLIGALSCTVSVLSFRHGLATPEPCWKENDPCK